MTNTELRAIAEAALGYTSSKAMCDARAALIEVFTPVQCLKLLDKIDALESAVGVAREALEHVQVIPQACTPCRLSDDREVMHLSRVAQEALAKLDALLGTQDGGKL